MPKDEVDPNDPMELHRVGWLTEDDTCKAMTECFIEEFMRLGHDAGRILALFRNPFYTGMNLVLQQHGETFVRETIIEVFGWWQRPVDFSAPARIDVPASSAGSATRAECSGQGGAASDHRTAPCPRRNESETLNSDEASNPHHFVQP